MIHYIDFKKLPKYKKILCQPLEYDEYVVELQAYFKKHKKYNFYSLALHFGMSDGRFTSNYVNSKDESIKELTAQAMVAIASNALDNADDYSKSLRYIMARQSTGKDFIELDSTMQEANQNKIIILPAKNK